MVAGSKKKVVGLLEACLQVRDLHRLRRAAEEAAEGRLLLLVEEMVGEFDVDLNAVFWYDISSWSLVFINRSFGDPSNTNIISHFPPQSAIRLFVVLS
jgi:hypothetical protein